MSSGQAEVCHSRGRGGWHSECCQSRPLLHLPAQGRGWGTGRTISQTDPQCGTKWRRLSPWSVPLSGAFVRAVTQQLRGSLVGAAGWAASFPGCKKDAVSWAGVSFSLLAQGYGGLGGVNTQMALPGLMRRCNLGRDKRRHHQNDGQGRTKGSFKGEISTDSASQGKSCESWSLEMCFWSSSTGIQAPGHLGGDATVFLGR